MIRKYAIAVLMVLLITVPAMSGTVVVQESELIGRTSTNLVNATAYTSSVKLAKGFGRVTVIVEASHDSATDGLVIQQSGDEDCNTSGSPNWDYESKYSYTAGQVDNGYSIETIGRCVRISYTNGSTTTTTLRIYSSLKTF